MKQPHWMTLRSIAREQFGLPLIKMAEQRFDFIPLNEITFPGHDQIVRFKTRPKRKFGERPFESTDKIPVGAPNGRSQLDAVRLKRPKQITWLHRKNSSKRRLNGEYRIDPPLTLRMGPGSSDPGNGLQSFDVKLHCKPSMGPFGAKRGVAANMTVLYINIF